MGGRNQRNIYHKQANNNRQASEHGSLFQLKEVRIKNTKKITYHKSDNYGRNIPCIIIEGKFLNDLGFKLGEKVNIDYQKDKIIITSIKKAKRANFFDN